MNLQAKNLFFDYGKKPLLQDVSFELTPGCLTVLLGCNGCGKSTLLKLLSGELVPKKGEVFLGDRSVRKWKDRDRAGHLSVAMQTLSSVLDFTVREMILTGRNARMSRFAGADDTSLELVRRMEKMFELEDLSERTYSSLSGGERQRVQLAGVFVNEPEVMLLDEPGSAADPVHVIKIMSLLREQARENTVLAVTHNLQTAARFAGRILLLHEGRIFADGTPEEVLTPPVLEEVYHCHAEILRSSSGEIVPLLSQD